MKLFAALLCLSLVLAACASKQVAPVSETRSPTVLLETSAAAAASVPTPAVATPEPRPASYTVKKGDTLYSIALDHGQSYRDLAAWNALEDPNKIQVGQQLRVTPATAPAAPEAAPAVAVAKPVTPAPAPEARALNAPAPTPVAQPNNENLKREPRAAKRPYSEETLAAMRRADSAAAHVAAAVEAPKEEPKAEAPAEAKPEAKPASEETVDWAWPAGGKLLNGFVEGTNKGVDIAAKAGEPVQAAAAGKVVYAGSSLRGYGKLVIVKHNAVFLSAYAHNSQLLVKEGQVVQKGQKIAEAGSSDADQTMLHFEIRRQGKPVDPVKYLPGR